MIRAHVKQAKTPRVTFPCLTINHWYHRKAVVVSGVGAGTVATRARPPGTRRLRQHHRRGSRSHTRSRRRRPERRRHRRVGAQRDDLRGPRHVASAPGRQRTQPTPPSGGAGLRPDPRTTASKGHRGGDRREPAGCVSDDRPDTVADDAHAPDRPTTLTVRVPADRRRSERRHACPPHGTRLHPAVRKPLPARRPGDRSLGAHRGQSGTRIIRERAFDGAPGLRRMDDPASTARGERRDATREAALMPCMPPAMIPARIRALLWHPVAIPPR